MSSPDFEKDFELWKVGLPFLICTGITKAIFYYQSFDIDITEYLSVSESLGYILNGIPFLLGVFISTLATSYFGIRKSYPRRKNFLNILISLPAISYGSYLIILDNSHHFLKWYFVALTTIATGSATLLIGNLGWKYTSGKGLLLFLGLFLAIELAIQAFTVDNIKREIPSQRYSYYFEGAQVIRPINHWGYIGRTDGFVFFYNDSSRAHIVFNTSKFVKEETR